ncbi:MAG: hypothetical protein JHC84_12865 [Solirubrobacteraceae bacterium]|nr:hypothetical protein [Solirubrobacteraceae bacterium]
MPEAIVVTGGSMAALATADALASAGQSVELLVPAKGVGAGFAPMRKDGRALELGVRLLELHYEGAEAEQVPPLAEYHPEIGGHRPFTPLVHDWIAERAGDRLVEAERARMAIDGRVVDDLYFTTDPSVLHDALSDDERAVIAAEARHAAEVEGDAGLLAPERAADLAAMNLDEASIACHGAAFHARLAEPYAAKVLAGGTSAVLATLRRKAWVPLFWPRTLAQACGDETIAFHPDRPFHTITGGGAGQIVDILMERLGAHPHVEVRTVGALEAVAPANGSGVRFEFSDAGTIHAKRPVIGNAPAELFGAAGIEYAPAKARTVILWIEVEDADLLWAPALLNVVDADCPVLRVSSGGSAAGPAQRILTVELAHDQDPATAEPAVRDALERFGVIREGARFTVAMAAAAPTFALPTAENVERFARARDELRARGLDADIVGGAADFAADALNEQIVQALKVTEERS